MDLVLNNHTRIGLDWQLPAASINYKTILRSTVKLINNNAVQLKEILAVSVLSFGLFSLVLGASL